MLDANTVLVGYDFSDGADHALAAAAEAAPSPDAVHVVHALRLIDPELPGLFWPANDDEARRQHARDALHARLAGTPLEHAHIHVVLGRPADRITALAKALDVDLIAVGFSGKGGLKRVLGSVAEHVASSAHCPVLVVHPEA